MNNKPRMRIILAGITLILVAMACALPGAPGAKPTATATPESLAALLTPTGTVTPGPGLSVGGSSAGAGGSSSGTGGTGGSNGGTGSSSSGSGDTGSSQEGTPTLLPDINARPYVVKQIETLGGEAISGFVCSLTLPFSVLSVTPHVTFSFIFVPQNAQMGAVSYSYSIKSAGESHQAGGTYTVAQVAKDGTQQVSLTVSDHVVFKGFDGNIPNRYKFNLVPTDNASCPPAP